MTSGLEEVQKHLSIKSVFLRTSWINIDENIEPGELANINSTSQSFRGVSLVRKTNLEDKEREWWEYSFHYSIGIRLINEEDEKNEDDTSPLVEITATFSAIYISPESLSEELVNAFSENNVGYHVWPYWREFMQSSCLRLNIKPLEVPLYFCSPSIGV